MKKSLSLSRRVFTTATLFSPVHSYSFSRKQTKSNEATLMVVGGAAEAWLTTVPSDNVLLLCVCIPPSWQWQHKYRRHRVTRPSRLRGHVISSLPSLIGWQLRHGGEGTRVLQCQEKTHASMQTHMRAHTHTYRHTDRHTHTKVIRRV